MLLYSLFIGIVLFVSGRSLIKNYIDKKMKTKSIYLLYVYEIIGIVIGAKLIDIATNFDIYLYYLKNNDYYRMLLNTFLGGIIGVIFSVYIYSKIYNENFNDISEIIFPNLLLIYALLKIGCFFNGCCYGIKFDNINIPIQIIEVIIYLCLYICINLIKDRNKKLYLLCILFGLIRFCIELFRAEREYIPNISQVFALIIFEIGIVLMIKKMRLKGNI